jgi:hypothetical protein
VISSANGRFETMPCVIADCRNRELCPREKYRDLPKKLCKPPTYRQGKYIVLAFYRPGILHRSRAAHLTLHSCFRMILPAHMSPDLCSKMLQFMNCNQSLNLLTTKTRIAQTSLEARCADMYAHHQIFRAGHVFSGLLIILLLHQYCPNFRMLENVPSG